MVDPINPTLPVAGQKPYGAILNGAIQTIVTQGNASAALATALNLGAFTGNAVVVTAGAYGAAATAGGGSQNDVIGSVRITTNSAPAANGVYAHVSFGTAKSAVPHVHISPREAASAQAAPYATNVTVNGFDIAFAIAPNASSVLTVEYVVLQ